MNVNLKVKREKAKLKGKMLYLSFSFALCVLSFALSAWGENEGITLQHRPENIAKGYRVISFIENNGAKEKKDQRFDLPIVRGTELADSVETTEILDLATITIRGLPVHIPQGAVGPNSTWDGWSEVGTLIIHHLYTFGNIKEVAGKKCAEVNYKLQAMQDQNVITGDGRFIFDLNNGVVVVHTWQINGSGLKADYAAVLNI